jgi:hypothetical protein
VRPSTQCYANATSAGSTLTQLTNVLSLSELMRDSRR